MPKKLQELAKGVGDSKLADQIRSSASEIWLAGLGAYATAQREGSKVYKALVAEGMTLQSRTKKSAEEAFAGIRAKATRSLDQLSWDQLERVFEERVARALHSLSVPSRKDLELLSKRVAELTAVTEKLSGGRGRAPARRAAKKAARKTVHRAARSSAKSAAAEKAATGA